MRDLDQLFQALDQSPFRRQFRLGGGELGYLLSKGMETVLEHATGFIEQRLAQANPPNDGRQTPKRNHPVFIAQHATATCCRGCLQKWHDIPKGRELREDENRYVLGVIERWLSQQAQIATGDSDSSRSSEKVGQTGSLPGFPKARVEGVKANCQFALPSRRDFHSFRASQCDRKAPQPM